MSFNNNLNKVVKIEKAISELFYKLFILESYEKTSENEYAITMELLKEAIVIEYKYLKKVCDYVFNTSNTFCTDPFRYIVKEIRNSNLFINDYEKEKIDENTDLLDKYFNQKEDNIIDYDNIYTSFINSIVTVKQKDKQEKVEFEYREDKRMKNNLIYQRIMYSLNTLKYTTFKKEIISGNFYDELGLSSICIPRDNAIIFIKELENVIEILRSEDKLKNTSIIKKLTYYKYIELFKYNILENNFFKTSYYSLLKYELYSLFYDKERVDNLYIEDGALDTDSFILNISSKIEEFKNSKFKNKYEKTFPKAIYFILEIKAKLYLLTNEKEIEKYCNEIYEEIIEDTSYLTNESDYSIILNYIRNAISEVLDYNKKVYSKKI